jgi:energy-coupling factor transport system ATP-binding protein
MIAIEYLRYRNLSVDTLAIQPGITSIIGANGSGKTSFLKICAGISLPDSGTVMIDGRPPRETEIGWVNEFPDRNILFVNGFDEIASSLRFRNAPCADIASSVRSCAESMGIMHLLTRPVREMSGGEKVLISLAAALVHHPKVLIFDEYDSHLDSRYITHIDQILSEWGADYVIRSTQQMDTAIRSDHLLFFDSGRILHSGDPRQVIPLLKGTAWFPVLWGCC